MNGLLMFINASVTTLAFTMWLATNIPGNASCGKKITLLYLLYLLHIK
jgi:hypothetical protein